METNGNICFFSDRPSFMIRVAEAKAITAIRHNDMPNKLKSSVEPKLTKYFWNGFEWDTEGDPRKESYYVGEIKNSKRNGQGTFRSMDGRVFKGEFKDDTLWNIKEYRKGKLIGKWKNGIKE